MTAHIIEAGRLRDFAQSILRASGSEEIEARIVAEHLVDANLRGHDSHGVGLIPLYMRDVKAGNLVPNRHPRLLSEFGAIAHYDAANGYGHVAAREVTLLAMAKAREAGVAVVGLANSHHVARVGSYGEMACAEGLVAILVANVFAGRQIVAPHGGADGRLHTNPICVAVPTGAREAPFVLDFATSKIALGKVRVAHNKAEPAPAGSLIDHAGEPTDDAATMFDPPFGALLPFGEHKGSGLAVMCELLAGAMLGGPFNHSKDPPGRGLLNNLLAIVLDPARFGETSEFRAAVDAVLDHVKASPPAAAAGAVLTAGEPERATRAARLATGIPVDRRTWDDIVTAGAELGVGAPGRS